MDHVHSLGRYCPEIAVTIHKQRFQVFNCPGIPGAPEHVNRKNPDPLIILFKTADEVVNKWFSEPGHC